MGGCGRRSRDVPRSQAGLTDGAWYPPHVPRTPLYKTPNSPMPRILEALRGGAELGEAARVGGIGVETLLRWMGANAGIERDVEAAQEAGRQKDEGPGGSPSSPPSPSADPSRAASAGLLGLPGVDRAALSVGGAGNAVGVHREPARPQSQDRWARIHEEAAALGPGLFGYLLWLEARIAAHNEKAQPWDRLPLMPEPLREIFRLFWASGKQELDILGGRGLGKTTMFCRPTVVECLFGPPVVAGGEIAIWPELAQDMDAAALSLGVLEKLLTIAGFKRGSSDNEGEFQTLRQERGRSRIKFQNAHRESIEIRVYPATVAALSGPTLKGARHDEEQKWRANAKDGTSSAEDVIDAEGGAFRGRPHAHLYRMSSAYSTATPHHRDTHGLDEHGKQINDGDTNERMVARLGSFLEGARAGFEARAQVSTPEDAAEIRAFAASLTERSVELPSWINTSLDPRLLKARNARVFLREYGSRTTGAGDDGDMFDGLALDAAERLQRPAREPDAVFAAIDTGAKRNPAALAIVGVWLEPKRNRSVIEAIAGLAGNEQFDRVFAPLLLRAWKPSPGRPLDLRLVVLPAMARETLAHGAGTWSTDGFASDQIDLVAAAHGIVPTYVATSEAYADVYAPVSDGLARGEVALSGCPLVAEAVAQLRRVSTESTITNDGPHIKVNVPEDASGEHGDIGVALVRALAAAGCGKVPEYSWGISAVPGRYADADPRAGAPMGGGSRMRA